MPKVVREIPESFDLINLTGLNAQGLKETRRLHNLFLRKKFREIKRSFKILELENELLNKTINKLEGER